MKLILFKTTIQFHTGNLMLRKKKKSFQTCGHSRQFQFAFNPMLDKNFHKLGKGLSRRWCFQTGFTVQVQQYKYDMNIVNLAPAISTVTLRHINNLQFINMPVIQFQYTSVGIFEDCQIFHTKSIMWNLGLLWKIATTGCILYST